MFKKLTIICLTVALSLSLALPLAVSAQDADADYFPDQFQGGATVLNEDTGLISIIAQLVNIFMGLLGMIAVILMLYGGFTWMTAQGDADKVKKAQQIIFTATVGIIVIFASWALATFAIDYIASSAVTG